MGSSIKHKKHQKMKKHKKKTKKIKSKKHSPTVSTMLKLKEHKLDKVKPDLAINTNVTNINANIEIIKNSPYYENKKNDEEKILKDANILIDIKSIGDLNQYYDELTNTIEKKKNDGYSSNLSKQNNKKNKEKQKSKKKKKSHTRYKSNTPKEHRRTCSPYSKDRHNDYKSQQSNSKGKHNSSCKYKTKDSKKCIIPDKSSDRKDYRSSCEHFNENELQNMVNKNVLSLEKQGTSPVESVKKHILTSSYNKSIDEVTEFISIDDLSQYYDELINTIAKTKKNEYNSGPNNLENKINKEKQKSKKEKKSHTRYKSNSPKQHRRSYSHYSKDRHDDYESKRSNSKCKTYSSRTYKTKDSKSYKIPYKDLKNRDRNNYRSSCEHFDKKELLKIANENVISLVKQGILPQGSVKKHILTSSSNKSIDELTVFCREISRSSKDEDDKYSSITEIKPPFHHSSKDRSNVGMEIENVTQFPVMSLQENTNGQDLLKQQLPISSVQTLSLALNKPFNMLSPEKYEELMKIPLPDENNIPLSKLPSQPNPKFTHACGNNYSLNTAQQFTGHAGTKALTVAELSVKNPPQVKNKKKWKNITIKM